MSKLNKVSPSAFKSLSKLANLDLSFNKLELFPRERLRGLSSLSIFNISHNNITKIDQLPTDAKNIKVLDLSYNHIENVNDVVFKHGLKLETVSLAYNQISTLHQRAFTHQSSLKNLQLNNNLLKNMPSTIFNPLKKSLKKLTLGENPWQCECSLLKLWVWLRGRPHLVEDDLNALCYQPMNIRGSAFLRLSPSDFCSQPLIEQVAIQDIQSRSAVVSWKAHNSSNVHGYKVLHQQIKPDVKSLMTSTPLNITTRSHRIEALNPGSTYQICVKAVTPSPKLINFQTGTPQECTRAVTLTVPATSLEVSLTGGIALIAASTVALMLAFSLLIGMICCLSKNKKPRPKPKAHNGSIVTTTNGTLSKAMGPVKIEDGEEEEEDKFLKKNGSNGGPPSYYSHFYGKPPEEEEEFAC